MSLLLTDSERNPTLMQKREENYHHPQNKLCLASKPNQVNEPENKTSEDSTDSEATEIYDPPKLPDETKLESAQARPLRGKLQIKKAYTTKTKQQVQTKADV